MAKKTASKKTASKKTASKKTASKKTASKKTASKKVEMVSDPEARDALVGRLHRRLAGREGMSEKKMFGGSCFLYQGNMIGGVMKDGTLCLRLGPEGGPAALAEPHTRPMTFTGRAMPSMIYVDAPGFASDAQLDAWIERAMQHAASLPPK